MGITTAEGWDKYYEDHPVSGQSNAQCSWNIDSQSAWKNTVASYTKYAEREEHVWNEVMLAVTDADGSVLKDKISAFFYDINQPQSLASARNFQIKLNDNGYNVPILRIDMTAGAASLFSYSAADQAIPQ